MDSWPRFLWICLGGAVGTGARRLLSLGISRVAVGDIPYATLAVNGLGCLLLGAILGVVPDAEGAAETTRLALTTGVMGGFTTYAAFNHETIELARRGSWGLAAAYASATFAGCLLAGLGGLLAGRRLAGL